MAYRGYLGICAGYLGLFGFWRVHGSPMGGTTGVSLEQGLGLTDISRGRPGRRPGGERSSPPDYYFIIDKINPGPHRGRLVGPLVPSS